MSIFLAGLALFFLGLEGNKASLKRISASRITFLLKKLSGNVFLSIFIGIAVTAVLQSSSAVSVILISLLEGEMIKLKPAACILLGANVGTTITVQIISLPVLDLYPHLIIAGLLLVIYGLVNSRKKVKYTGYILISFGAIFAGIQLMSAAFLGGKERNIISRVVKYADGKYSGILAGIFLTSLVQSSSIISGTTLSLAKNNLIGLPAAVAIALGSNVGTCITAMLASYNCSQPAKILALIHLIFNITGIILLLIFFNNFIHYISLTSPHIFRQIANAHTLFNTIHLCIFFPLFYIFINRNGGDRLWKS
ncbi:MAG: Na/Pi cotransporter family protein [Halanaerobiales bacterium]